MEDSKVFKSLGGQLGIGDVGRDFLCWGIIVFVLILMVEGRDVWYFSVMFDEDSLDIFREQSVFFALRGKYNEFLSHWFSINAIYYKPQSIHPAYNIHATHQNTFTSFESKLSSLSSNQLIYSFYGRFGDTIFFNVFL